MLSAMLEVIKGGGSVRSSKPLAFLVVSARGQDCYSQRVDSIYPSLDTAVLRDSSSRNSDL